ncbi:MAG: PaaI family thioesterase [Hyphomicrobiaceae bacterium]
MKIDVPKTLDEWNARGREFLPGHLEMYFVEVSGTRVLARLKVKKSVLSWNGFLHAGSVVSLADTCCGYGTLSSLPNGADGFTTLDLTSNFIGTALEGEVTCSARPLHQGRTTQVWDARVVHETTSKLIACFRCTQLVLWPRK